jgi:hypothetical protein
MPRILKVPKPGRQVKCKNRAGAVPISFNSRMDRASSEIARIFDRLKSTGRDFNKTRKHEIEKNPLTLSNSGIHQDSQGGR